MNENLIPHEENKNYNNNLMLNLEVMKMIAGSAKRYAVSNLVPDNYKGKEADCFIACEMALRINVSPLMVMQNLYIVKGRPVWSGQSCIAFVNNSNKFDEPLKLVMVGEKDKDTWGCYAETKKNDETVKGTLIDMKMVKSMGWSNNPMWKGMPEQMFKYRAAAFFAKEHCPEILMGCMVEGESEDTSNKKVFDTPDIEDLIGGKQIENLSLTTTRTTNDNDLEVTAL